MPTNLSSSVVLLLIVCQLGAAQASSRLPQWPGHFFSAYWSPGKRTIGVFANGLDKSGVSAELVTLEDGSSDHLCSTYHNNTRCTILTADKWKWLVWPDLADCCKCCPISKGCGPLASGWLNNASGNIFYAGITGVDSALGTFQCHKWMVQGLDPENPNYYYEHTGANASEGTPCEIDGYNYLYVPSQRADDQYIFDPSSYSTQPAPTLFDMPDYCKESSFCEGRVCDKPPAPIHLLHV
mmetsp:Transcript_27962/g.64534  ORF Transcript_27962/g.64534 Transcript_27962/m.64534 type:complete len:239 (+) Transcript_27962:55-771(+)